MMCPQCGKDATEDILNGEKLLVGFWCRHCHWFEIHTGIHQGQKGHTYAGLANVKLQMTKDDKNKRLIEIIKSIREFRKELAQMPPNGVFDAAFVHGCEVILSSMIDDEYEHLLEED